MASQKNEFLRSRPAQKNKNVLYDISNFCIPVFLVLIGFILFAQFFAKYTGYDRSYTLEPFWITKQKILFIPRGYPFFNPLLILMNCLAHPFDPLMNSIILPALFPLFIAALFAVISFFVISFVRGAGINHAKNLYGTARWANEKDLKKFGLTSTTGVVLAEFQKAELDFSVNPKNSSVSLKLKKPAPLVCHQGGTNTLTIAPTRSGKGVGSIIPTCLNYPQSMIIFDPKGELFETTAGFRKQFSHVLKFSPISHDTVRFNPLEEVDLTEQAFADIGLILTNMFDQPKGGEPNSTSSFFDNNAQDLLTGIIFHVLSSKNYPKEMKTLNGVLTTLSRAGAKEKSEEDDDEDGSMGEALLKEMRDSEHFDKFGNKSDYMHNIIANIANRCLKQNVKVRSDVFSTIFSRMRLFEDPFISYVTSESDFKLSDFYESKEPITLYLTVPFSDIKRIASVFRLLISFMLNKFSRGEASYGSENLKNRIVFLIDEFKTLGAFPFLSDTMGILAGYGITFYIVVQALNQIVDLYSANHTFLDNCKTVMVYAPGKIEDAKVFSEMIGKESVVNENLSFSGSRYSVSLNNLNASGQEIARELINPDELMKLPPTEALILNQGMPPYIAKKCVYYEDKRFAKKAYSLRKITNYYFFIFRLSAKTGKAISESVFKFLIRITEKEIITGFKPPATRKELEIECSHLPSQMAKQKIHDEETKRLSPAVDEIAAASMQFNPADYLSNYEEEEEPDQHIPQSCVNLNHTDTVSTQENQYVEETENEDGTPAGIPEVIAMNANYYA
jgi:type IV secretion system protein VirD4